MSKPASDFVPVNEFARKGWELLERRAASQDVNERAMLLEQLRRHLDPHLRRETAAREPGDEDGL